MTNLDRIERRILRIILGPKCVEGVWRSRHNKEISAAYRPSLSNYIRIQRLKWLRHLVRIQENRVERKVYERTSSGKRPGERPKSLWKKEATRPKADWG